VSDLWRQVLAHEDEILWDDLLDDQWRPVEGYEGGLTPQPVLVMRSGPWWEPSYSELRIYLTPMPMTSTVATP
jgi:hypothetical protein